MPIFQSSSFKNRLGLPSAENISSSGAVADSISTEGSQITSDYTTASSAQLQAEALQRLQKTGEADQFDSLTRRIDIVSSSGNLIAQDAATGQSLVNVGQVPSNSTAANTVPSPTSKNTLTRKVRIVQSPQINDGSSAERSLNEVILEVMPSISESRNAQYNIFSPIHHPGEILKYEHTTARSWSFDVMLVSRTIEEATQNLKIINTIRSWVMPFYGQGTANNPATNYYLGAPPPILTITALGDDMIGPVRCVLEGYTFNFQNTVDYIPSDSGTPVPTIFHTTLNFKEAWSPAEYSGFDLAEYRAGNLGAAFKSITVDQQPVTRPQLYAPPEGIDPAQAQMNSANRRQGTIDVSQGAIDEIALRNANPF